MPLLLAQSANAYSTLNMMLVGPVTVFTLVSIWIATLLHTEVPRQHYNTQGLQPRLHPRVVRRLVGPERQPQHGLRLVVWMSPQPLDQTSEAPVGRSTQGRTKATGVRVCVHHLCAEPGNGLDGLRDTARYLFEQSPADHPSTHAHYQDILYALRQQEERLHRIQDIFRTSFWTPTLWHRHLPKCPLLPPLGVSPIGLNLIRTPQTTRVGYTFPPLTLGFQNGQNKPSWNMEKKMFIFLIPQEILAWPAGRLSGKPRLSPTLVWGLRLRGRGVHAKKINDSVVHMRPHELCLPQEWAFMFIFIYEGLRVGVRVRGLGLLGPAPRFIHDVTFWITSSPPCHHPHHDVILPMTSQFPGGEGFPRG